jgi:hypothetical protein
LIRLNCEFFAVENTDELHHHDSDLDVDRPIDTGFLALAHLRKEAGMLGYRRVILHLDYRRHFICRTFLVYSRAGTNEVIFE